MEAITARDLQAAVADASKALEAAFRSELDKFRAELKAVRTQVKLHPHRNPCVWNRSSPS